MNQRDVPLAFVKRFGISDWKSVAYVTSALSLNGVV